MQQERTLTRESFSQLLEWLGHDRKSGGDQYEIIRNRLIRYFTIKGCYEADRLADQTIDRVSLKVATVSDTFVGDPVWYFLNVAAKIYLEWSRDPRRAAEPILFEPSAALIPEDDGEFACLDKCLGELPEEARTLIVAYYSTEERTHITERKGLADELGISLSALHIRASRIRTKLYSCVRTCIDKHARKVS